MICMVCNRNLVNCICDDADVRIASLAGSPFLDQQMIHRIQAQRLLNKFDIDRERAGLRSETVSAEGINARSDS